MKSSSPGVGLWENKPCTTYTGYICEYPRSGYTTPFVSTTTTITPPQCPTNWTKYSGNCYKVKYTACDPKHICKESLNNELRQSAVLLLIHCSVLFSFGLTGLSEVHREVKTRIHRYNWKIYIVTKYLENKSQICRNQMRQF